MSDIGLAFRHRVPVHYYARFQGLPGNLFGDGPDPGLAGVQYSPSLRISDQVLSSEIKTGQPIGSGRALDILLDADTLAASGVYSGLFNPPSQMTAIDGAITITQTTINVKNTSAFASSGFIYWGHEKIAYTGKTSTSFTGCTRGDGVTSSHINYATAAPSGVSGIWGMVTERPVLWRGRLVEIWAVAATPAGDLLGAPFTVSDACWRVWIGHVDGQAVFVTTGVSIRALPAERSIDRDYGWGQVWKIANDPFSWNPETWWKRVVYWPPGGKINVQPITVQDDWETFTLGNTKTIEPASGEDADSVARLLSVKELWQFIADFGSGTADGDALLFLGQGFPHSLGLVAVDGSLDEPIHPVSGGGSFVTVLKIWASGNPPATLRFNAMGEYNEKAPDPNPVGAAFYYDSQYYHETFFNCPPPAWKGIPSWYLNGGFWIEQPEEGSDQIYAGPPLAGYHVAWESDDHVYTAKVAHVIPVSNSWSASQYFVVLGPPIIGPAQVGQNDDDPSELKEVVFIDGQQTIGGVWEQLLQTSGGAIVASSTPGSFGSADLLPIGWGARVPSDWIAAGMAAQHTAKAVNPFVAYDLDADSLYIDAIAGKVSLTQKFVSGEANIDTADLGAPQEGDTTTTISTNKILAEPIRIGERDKPPNAVEIEWYSPNRPKLIVRNALRIHSEGSVKKRSFKLPDSWEGDRLDALASSVMTPDQLLSDVYVYEISVGPEQAWSVNPGDKVTFSGTHYAFANPTSGAHRGSSLTGRVVGVTRKLDGSGGTIKMHFWPAITGNYYCPDSEISSINSGTETITLPAGRAAWFWADVATDVLFYRPGDEGTYLETSEMQSSSSNNITVDSLPSWLTTADRITFAQTATASDRQKAWAHVDDLGHIP